MKEKETPLLDTRKIPKEEVPLPRTLEELEREKAQLITLCDMFRKDSIASKIRVPVFEDAEELTMEEIQLIETSLEDEKMKERKDFLDQLEKNRSERRRTEDYIDFLRGKDIKENRDFIAFLRGKKPKEEKE